jgi:branched-chain amino acid transport system substrate-binding protein
MPEDQIHIAVAGPLGGVSAHLGREMTQAVRLAVEEQNAEGGIGGVPVVLHIVDDEGDPRRGIAAAHQLCATRDVLAVIGHYNSDVTLEAAPLYAKSELTMIAPIVSNPALTEHGLANVFRFTNRDDKTARVIAGHLRHALDMRRAVVVETSTTYGASMATEFVRAYGYSGGEVLDRYTVPEGERDFAPILNRLPRHFDVLFYGGSFEGAAIVKAMRSAGMRQLFAAGDGCWDISGFLEPAGQAAEGALVLSASPQVGHVPGSAEFARRYESRYGRLGNYAVNSYDATQLLLVAIAAMPRSRPDVVESIRQMHYTGIAYARPTEWDEHGDNLAAGTFLYEVSDGRYRQIGP